jgi:Cu2+-exporting ATPase
VLILAGEAVPTDGVIIEGKSRVDESLLTGESRALSKNISDVLVGGSMNLDSPLQMRVTHIGQDTILSTILNLLERAQSEKPKISQLADRIATRFVSVIVFLAIAVGLYYGIYIDGFASTNWIGIVVAVLVVTCPCALSLATPAAMTIAIGRLSQIGLLIRTKQALETLERADYFAFDKTGTLTQGRLQFECVVECQNIEKEQALAIATALEKSSEHPIAQAFLNNPDDIGELMCSGLSRFILPPTSTSLIFLDNARLSPVNNDSSTLDFPSIITPSVGTASPAKINTLSSTFNSTTGTTSSP